MPLVITGAAGPLGAHITRALLQGSRHTIYCLVPRAQDVALDEHEQLRLIEYDLAAGPTALPDGIGALEHIDEVWHTDTLLGPALRQSRQLHQDDLARTRKLLDLLRGRRVGVFNLVSSAFVAGLCTGTIPEAPFDARFPTNNIFEETNRRAEMEVAERCRAEGIRWRVFRPSMLSCARPGEAGSAEDVWGLLALLCRFKADIDAKLPEYLQRNPLRLLAAPDAALNLIRVDKAADRMIRIARGDEAAEGYFHLVEPTDTPLVRLCEAVGRALGCTIELVDQQSALSPIDDLLHRRLAPWRCYLQQRRHFESKRAVAAADDLAPPSPAGDPAEEHQIRAFHQAWTAAREASLREMRSALERMERRTIDLGADGSLDYHVGGAGEQTLIFINALGQRLFMWHWLLLRFSQRYRVIAWVPRGTFGAKPLTIEDQVADLERIVERERVTSCRILCWCNGTRVGLEFQHRHQPSVSSMVFINGSFKPVKALERFYTLYEKTLGQLCEMVSRKPQLAPVVMKSMQSFLSGAKSPQAEPSLSPADVLSRCSSEIMTARRSLTPGAR
jgi:nucleoside-diphosphate-sugar epimerase